MSDGRTTPQSNSRPVTWRELTTAFIDLTVAVSQALAVERIPNQARTVLVEAQSKAAAVRSRIRVERPGRRR